MFPQSASLRRTVDRSFSKLGLVLDRRDSTLAELRFRLLREHAVSAVIDVGANVGQYARELRRGGFDGSIVSVEPLADAYEKLTAAARSDPAWTCHRTLLGKTEGEAVVHVAGNSVSSSIFAMEKAHERAAPGSAFVREERVQTTTLDRLLEQLPASLTASTFLKVDTQGAELEVLGGAANWLQMCVGIEVEMSLIPLYVGAPTYLEVGGFLAAAGFVPVAFQRGFTDPDTRQTLQMDGLFKRGD